jgi:carboxypeptidase C (cathepsin A)
MSDQSVEPSAEPRGADLAEPPGADKPRAEREAVTERLNRRPVHSSGTLDVPGSPALNYRSSCEYIPVLQGGLGAEADEPQAAVFVTSYQAMGAAAAGRGVCFAFNGGPGSSSVWLHLGALGPQRIVVPDDGTMPAPPYVAQPNPLSWLRHVDLVFIDPPHTGWSVAAGESARKRLLSVDGDVAALTEVMRVWLTRHQRWSSPVYLAGESYGTTRGAAMAESLLDAGIALSGLVLVSCAMDLQSIFHSPRNDLPYVTFLPGMTAVAHYHGRLRANWAKSLGAACEAAQAFAEDDYQRALFAGARLSAREHSRVARRVADLTGLSAAYVAQSNLRITPADYFTELLREQGLQIGRLDARSTAPLGARRERAVHFDPGIDAIAAPYAMAARAYFRDVLGVDEERRYELLNMAVNKGWNWNRGDVQGNAYCSTSDDLSRALRRNPRLRVLVASGRYDLGTPYSASDWSLAQLDIPSQVRARVSHFYCDAGHMFYTRQADLERWFADWQAWLRPEHDHG